MRMFGIGLAALVVATGGAAQAAPAAAKPVYREIRDFVVACDNLRSCEVRWAPDRGQGPQLYVIREGGPASALVVLAGNLAEEGAVAPDPRTLKLDGRPFGRDVRWEREEFELTVQGEDALRVLRTLREGRVVTYATGGETHEVALDGLKAALLLVDETQGRLGTVGAFVRTGPAADATVPPALPEPTIISRPADRRLTAPTGFAARVRRAQAGALERNSCDDEFLELDEAYPLNRDEVLVVLGCMMHAYQSSTLVLRAPREAPERAKLVAMPLAAGDEPVSPQDAGRYIEGSWDPGSATFSEFSKGRGLADCGSATVWAFDGTAFRLAEAFRMHRCSGAPPGDWPRVFRSKVQPRR